MTASRSSRLNVTTSVRPPAGVIATVATTETLTPVKLKLNPDPFVKAPCVVPLYSCVLPPSTHEPKNSMLGLLSSTFIGEDM